MIKFKKKFFFWEGGLSNPLFTSLIRAQNPELQKKKKRKEKIKRGQRLVFCSVMLGCVFRGIFYNMHPKLLAKLCLQMVFGRGKTILPSAFQQNKCTQNLVPEGQLFRKEHIRY